MQAVAIAVLVVVMMIAIGLRTQPREFVEVGRRPIALVVIAVVNVAVVPVLVLALARAVGLPREVEVGLLICASAPGGPTGPLFAAIARGHLAAAVTAMVSLALLSVVTAPAALALTLGAGASVDGGPAGAMTASMLGMVRMLAGVQLLPLLLGMGLRRLRPALADRLAGPMNRVANLLLVAIVLGLLATKWRVLAEVGLPALVLAAALVPLSMLLGYAVPGPAAQRRSFAFVTGVRNISLALLLGAAYFPAPLTDATILSFGLVCMLLPLAIAHGVGRAPTPGAQA